MNEVYALNGFSVTFTSRKWFHCIFLRTVFLFFPQLDFFCRSALFLSSHDSFHLCSLTEHSKLLAKVIVGSVYGLNPRTGRMLVVEGSLIAVIRRLVHQAVFILHLYATSF